MADGDTCTDDTDHTNWAGGWYCNIHEAGFESQEMERNDGDCPWCGRSLHTDTDHSKEADRDD